MAQGTCRHLSCALLESYLPAQPSVPRLGTQERQSSVPRPPHMATRSHTNHTLAQNISLQWRYTSLPNVCCSTLVFLLQAHTAVWICEFHNLKNMGFFLFFFSIYTWLFFKKDGFRTMIGKQNKKSKHQTEIEAAHKLWGTMVNVLHKNVCFDFNKLYTFL